MRIVLYVEGETEQAFKRHLKAFLDDIADRDEKQKVGLVTRTDTHRHRLQRNVARDLGDPQCLGVVVLVDVYPEFGSPEAVREHYGGCGGQRFRAHCALHDFEAWLLPYWQRVFEQAGRRPPKNPKWLNPETVNVDKPPSRVLREDVFTGKPGYQKTVHAARILEGQDLRVAAEASPQLKLFLNTLLEFAGYETRI
ncbi:MAG: DUF4276 family protein [Armatimonadetes bacterium]|nr:DUF4276 family protein [Armatimonadota bacterium]